MDDGTVARLDDELFYVTTTSTGSEGVVEWFEWWNAIWGYDAEIVNVTGALAAMNLAGPRAREALAPLTDADLANESFRYLDAKQIAVAGVPCLALRIGFVGELGYELHCPATDAGQVWDALVAAGATPFGLEAQRVLRLEKGHVIVGQDTDSESNLVSARMQWTIKDDKPDFVGKLAVPHLEVREKLVGFTTRRPPAGRRAGGARRTDRRPRDERAGQRARRRRHRPRLGRPGQRGGGRDDLDPHRRHAAPGGRDARAVLRPRRSAAPLVTRLSFLSPVSPPLRILEVRGGVPDGSIPIGPDRALVVGDDVGRSRRLPRLRHERRARRDRGRERGAAPAGHRADRVPRSRLDPPRRPRA